MTSQSPDKISKRPSVGYTLQASKWQRTPFLIDLSEMASLIASLGDFWIAKASGVIKNGEELIDPNEFMEIYASYINALKNGKIPADPRIRPAFSTVWTSDLNTLYSVPVDEKNMLVKVEKPVIQLQMHRFDYFPADDKFRSMVFGEEAIYWGIQVAFPYMYQNAACEIVAFNDKKEFANLNLFKKFQQWTREYTSPTPLTLGQKKVNIPIRLGKKCFEWINRHPQLALKGLKVLT